MSGDVVSSKPSKKRKISVEVSTDSIKSEKPIQNGKKKAKFSVTLEAASPSAFFSSLSDTYSRVYLF